MVVRFSDNRLISDFIASQSQPVWALLDGMSCRDLPQLAQGSQGGSLYKPSSKLDPALSPWLLRVQQGSRLAEDLAILPPDMHWGLVFTSGRDFEALRSHFRRFTMMWIDGADELAEAPVYFRFYDPRVMVDCIDCLTPEHLTALLDPVQDMAIPLSPLLGNMTGLSPLARRDQFRGQALIAEHDNRSARPQGSTAFRISGREFKAFSQRQQKRGVRKLARELQGAHPDLPDGLILAIAEKAPEVGASYQMDSIQQIRLIADCMIWHGIDFDTRSQPARQLLLRRDHLAWRKADALRDWLEKSKANVWSAHPVNWVPQAGSGVQG